MASIFVWQHYESFVHTFSRRVHPNHQLMVEAETHLAMLYGNLKPHYLLQSMPRPLLERKIQACHKVLDVMGKVRKITRSVSNKRQIKMIYCIMPTFR